MYIFAPLFRLTDAGRARNTGLHGCSRPLRHALLVAITLGGGACSGQEPSQALQAFQRCPDRTCRMAHVDAAWIQDPLATAQVVASILQHPVVFALHSGDMVAEGAREDLWDTFFEIEEPAAREAPKVKFS